jgi:hypothetical protein
MPELPGAGCAAGAAELPSTPLELARVPEEPLSGALPLPVAELLPPVLEPLLPARPPSEPQV